MAGICGILHSDERPPDISDLKRLSDTLYHRGKGGEDIYLSRRGCALASRYHGAASPYPLLSPDEDIALAYDGTLYNAVALRAELERSGHVFTTHTDHEIIQRGYQTWGIAVVERLRGLFAFALWSQRARALYLVRDRVGQKPLYYARWSGSLVFASEAKALLRYPGAVRRLNHDALIEYLSLGYVISPNTLFEGILKVVPGSWLRFAESGADGGAHQSHTYWQPLMDTATYPPFTQASDDIRQQLEEVIALQGIEGGGIGTFLSGGVDSTAVTALAARHTDSLHGYTVRYDFEAGSKGDSKFNVDLPFARESAAAFGVQLHEVPVQQTEKLAALLPHIVYALDEPIGEVALIQPAHIAAEAAMNGMHTLLSGDGADELYYGFGPYHIDYRVQQYQRIPEGLRRRVLDRLLPAYFDRLTQRSLIYTLVDRYLAWQGFFTRAELHQVMLTPAAQLDARLDAYYARMETILRLPETPYSGDRMAYATWRWWLPENANPRADRIGNTWGVEIRAPFQDHQLVDYAYRLPIGYKLPKGGKKVLKHALADSLPADVLRRPKWGFVPPTSDWLRTAFRPLLEAMLTPDRLTMLGLNPAFGQKMMEEHLGRTGYHMPRLWLFLMLQLWHAIYIEESLTPAQLTAEEVLKP